MAGDFKSRVSSVRTKLLGSRRGSATSASNASSAGEQRQDSLSLSLPTLSRPRKIPSSARLRRKSIQKQQDGDDTDLREDQESLGSAKNGDPPCLVEATTGQRPESVDSRDLQALESSIVSLPSPAEPLNRCPALTIEEPTPDTDGAPATTTDIAENQSTEQTLVETDEAGPLPTSQPQQPQSPRIRPTASTIRRQSLVNNSNTRIIRTLLSTDKHPTSPGSTSQQDYFSGGPPTVSANMLYRKIWVKRPGASATLVQIREDDLVDDVRDMILRKYANSLGRSFDSPDVTLRIVPRDHTQRLGERILGPEEEMCRTLDAYYPEGQTVDEALLIDVPQRRTPKPSPRAVHHMSYYLDDSRPIENGAEYFPPMPAVAPSPAALTTVSHDSRQSHAAHERAMSAIHTGQVPPLPSPGGASNRRSHQPRPRLPRQHTSSPTAITSSNSINTIHPSHLVRQPTRPRLNSTASDDKHAPPPAPPLPTPPAPDHAPTKQAITPPTPRVSSPRPPKSRRKQRDANAGSTPDAAAAAAGAPALPSGLLDGSVPPINVLIVEDNLINLKILEAFMKRLRVRWATAQNGREAVTKWRAGGYHLVLMDIQLPIMSGLEATKEIRRLERVNGIGVFSNGRGANVVGRMVGDSDGEAVDGEGADGEVVGKGKEVDREDDKLGDRVLFKSPVIIVALTASSLQSDRHEALAAGCNDFLTKPVNFVWLERKVKEWGCMQALIDFDGWRKWKDFAAQSQSKGKGGAAALAASKKGAKEKDAAPTRKELSGPTTASGQTDGSVGEN